MPLLAHLRELRKRFLLALLGIAVAAVVGWIFYEPVFDAMQQPVLELNEHGQEAALTFATPAAAFDMKIRVSLWLGVFGACPWWLYQIWAFLNPGLTSAERRYAVAFVGVGIPLFLAGAGLAWLILPNAVRLLTEFTPEGALNYMPATEYMRFFMRVILAFGIAFLVPLVMVLLNFLGVVRAKTLLAGWRWAVLAIFTFAAFASPTPDPWTMILLALPICGLYFLAVGIAAQHDRRADARAARAARAAEA
ncbi:twin-arginine translocase subunit TatC [Georgenia faecalis]|uniref:Sec-independent protein translocase protein TatC n=1 Tax=Georgenia faecalis TaxID=2483799 RepID=A0ABV9D9Q2_9MICO|nr:twin-arginine translocase subunit TatC [Georgenia faecalis]